MDDNLDKVVGKDNYRLLSTRSNIPYIPKKNHQAISDFKYAGEDRSYIYVYILSPLADSFASILPK